MCHTREEDKCHRKKNVLDDFIFHNSDLFFLFFKSEKDVEIPT